MQETLVGSCKPGTYRWCGAVFCVERLSITYVTWLAHHHHHWAVSASASQQELFSLSMSSNVFSSLVATYLCSSSSSSSAASKSTFDGVYATAHDAEVYASILSQATAGNHSCVGRKPILVAQPASVGDVKRVLALTQAWVREGNGNVDAPPLCIWEGDTQSCAC